MKEYSDAELVKGSLEGNQKIQAALYHKYEGRMYGICLRYANDQPMALDILQEGFIRVFRGLHTYKGNAPLAKWMDRVQANTAIRYISKNKRFSFKEDSSLERLMKGKNDTLHRSNAKDIVSLIQQLPLGYRTVFNMFAVEGYSHKEIGQQLGITEGSSRSQYFRAKKAMQHLLRENEMI